MVRVVLVCLCALCTTSADYGSMLELQSSYPVLDGARRLVGSYAYGSFSTTAAPAASDDADPLAPPSTTTTAAPDESTAAATGQSGAGDPDDGTVSQSTDAGDNASAGAALHNRTQIAVAAAAAGFGAVMLAFWVVRARRQAAQDAFGGMNPPNEDEATAQLVVTEDLEEEDNAQYGATAQA